MSSAMAEMVGAMNALAAPIMHSVMNSGISALK
jgi:hypothetical protein